MAPAEIWFFVLSGAFGIFVIGAPYAGVYGLIAQFGMKKRLNFLRSWWAAGVGLVLGMAFVGGVATAAFYYGFTGWGSIGISLGGLALIMTLMNALLVRTRDGGKITFLQGLILHVPPNVFLFAYAIATRPPG